LVRPNSYLSKILESLKKLTYKIQHLLKLCLFFLVVLSVTNTYSQPKIIDEIVAVVGGNVILLSDIETQYLQYRMQGNISGSTGARCNILETLLYQKLLIHQAEIDSVVVSDSRVESSMDARLRYYISQIGSQEKLEEYYQKSVNEIKEEFRELVREQMRGEQVQMNITSDVQITPSEVKNYYNRIPYDSLPLLNTEFIIGQIVKNPPVSIEELSKSFDKIKDLRNRIINGEKFSTLAILYSEDPGSAAKGGELGMFNRGTMFPEFEAAAFNLKQVGEVSEIVKTEVGYHIVQLIERQGEYINVRHILIRPKVSPYDLQKAKDFLDSIAVFIENDSISFKEAAMAYSDDPGKINGGVMVNYQTNTNRFESDELEPSVFFVIDKLEEGEISKSVPFLTESGEDAFRILYLEKRTKPHRANLKDDYNKIQSWALEEKRGRVINDWVNEKIEDTYIKINDKYHSCPFMNNWIKEN